MEESELEEESKFEEEFIPLDFGSLSDDDWCVIHNNFPELRKRRKPPLDDFIVEFLRRYDVFVTPITSGTRDRRQGPGIVTGAIAGAFGPDVVGDAYLIAGQQNMISGQKKQTAVQEWSRWKQWALDHPDFNDFVDSYIEKANRHNERVEELLFTEEVQRDIIEVLKEANEKRAKKKNIWNYLATLPILIIVSPLFLVVFYVIKEVFFQNKQ